MKAQIWTLFKEKKKSSRSWLEFLKLISLRFLLPSWNLVSSWLSQQVQIRAAETKCINGSRTVQKIICDFDWRTIPVCEQSPRRRETERETGRERERERQAEKTNRTEAAVCVRSAGSFRMFSAAVLLSENSWRVICSRRCHLSSGGAGPPLWSTQSDAWRLTRTDARGTTRMQMCMHNANAAPLSTHTHTHTFMQRKQHMVGSGGENEQMCTHWMHAVDLCACHQKKTERSHKPHVERNIGSRAHANNVGAVGTSVCWPKSPAVS